MQTFPGFLVLKERPVLVLGGGENAARKICLLLKAGAAVTVAASAINDEIAGHIAAGRLRHRAAGFSLPCSTACGWRSAPPRMKRKISRWPMQQRHTAFS